MIVVINRINYSEGIKNNKNHVIVKVLIKLNSKILKHLSQIKLVIFKN